MAHGPPTTHSMPTGQSMDKGRMKVEKRQNLIYKVMGS